MSLRMGPAIHPEEQPDARRRAFRTGIVKEQDASNVRVRVAFPEFDQMLSYWLPVVMAKTQNDKVYWMPDVGEQVVCLMDERDEAGVVLGSIYSSVDTAQVDSPDKFRFGFKDGTAIEYDRSSHVLELSFMDAATIKYDAGEHSFAIDFGDATSIAYRATTHVLSIVGGAASSALVAVPAGIVLQAGDSQVTIAPSGVSISPALPLSSTVAQT